MTISKKAGGAGYLGKRASDKNDNRGGAGRGQGNKPKYSEPTTTVAFRVPISKVSEIKTMVGRKLNSYKIKKPVASRQ